MNQNEEQEKQNNPDEEDQVQELQTEELEDVSCGKCQEYLLGWRRALADYDNLQKNLSRERQQIRQHVAEDCVQAVLPVLDNFSQALKHKPQTDSKEIENWFVGVLHMQKQLEDALTSLGFELYGAIGETFDENLHEAVEQKESDETSGNIIEIIQSGWKKGERIVRPAKVIISK